MKWSILHLLGKPKTVLIGQKQENLQMNPMGLGRKEKQQQQEIKF